MSTPGETRPATPRAMFERLLPMFLAKDLEGFADLFAEDGVHELPFAPPGVPRHIRGRDNIRGYFRAITETPLAHRELRSVTIYETTDPEVAIAEYDAHGEVTFSGQPYVIRYLQIMRLVNGQIASWCDYWNPAEAARLLGAPQFSPPLAGEDVTH